MRSPRSRAITVALVCSLLWPSSILASPPQSNAALLTRAQWLVEHDRVERAIAVLKQAIARDPSDPSAVARLASLVLPSADDARAVDNNGTLAADARLILAAIEDVAQRDDTGVGGRADSLFAERVWATVFAASLGDAVNLWMTRELRLDRAHSTLGRALASLAVRRDDLATAQRVLETCLRLDAEDATLRSDLAAVLLARGRVNDALVLFRQVAVAAPSDLNAQRDLAGALLAQGDALAATGLLEQTRGCSASCPCTLELTRAAVTAQRHTTAIEAAGHALRVCAIDDVEPMLWLGLSEQRAGRLPQARAALQAALRRDAGSSRARAALQALDTN